MAGASAHDGFDDQTTIPAAALNGLTAWTVATWMFVTEDSSESPFGDDWTAATGMGAVFRNFNNVNLELWQNSLLVASTAVNSAPLSTWMHVAITGTGTSFQIFLDGTLRASGTGASATLRNVNHFIGTSVGGFFLTIRAASFKVWNKVLTADEIKNEFRHRIPSNRASQNLGIWYELWESAGTVAFNLAGSGNNGTHSGGVGVAEGPPIRMSRGGWPTVIRPQVVAFLGEEEHSWRPMIPYEDEPTVSVW